MTFLEGAAVWDMEASTTRAIEAAGPELKPEDAGAVAGLVMAAKLLDGGVDPMKYLPVYLRYCNALGLTPEGRANRQPEKVAQNGKLDELKRRRAARAAGE